MKQYDSNKIEKKWQKYWEEKGIYKTQDYVKGKKNFYALSEFAYPSGNLHVGHWYAFAVPDIYARYKRMGGYNVLYPIGFDAFGLPAENAAIKRGLDPRKWTYENMDYMKGQLKSMGASFDWDRSLATCDPEYYKWTQWMFTEFYKNNLVDRQITKTNWCDSCKTVLANEQVVNGKCERCDSDVTQKDMAQWMLNITEFADDLVDDLDTLDWDHSIKQAQREWIGRKEGSEIKFKLKRDFTNHHIVILHGFMSTPDDGFIPWLKKELELRGNKVDVPFLPNTSSPSIKEQVNFVVDNINLTEDTIIIGHSLGSVVGLKLSELYKLQKLILIAPFIDRIGETGHRPYDNELFFDFKKIKDNVNSFFILEDQNDIAISSSQVDRVSNSLGKKKEVVIANAAHFLSKKEESILKAFDLDINVFTTRADTLFGVTYVVLAPEHELIRELKDQIENWDEVEKYLKETEKKSDLDRQQSKEKTGVELKGVSVVNPATRKDIPVWVADYVLSDFGTGAVMAVPAHDERDAEFALKYNLPFKFVILPSAGEIGNSRPLITSGENAFIKSASETLKTRNPDVSVQDIINEEWNAMYDLLGTLDDGIIPPGKRFCCVFEGKLINSPAPIYKEDAVIICNGKTSEEAKKMITEAVGGIITKTYRLRDWGISRQRYWGTPIPIVYDPEGRPHIVQQEHLPWILPEDVDFTPDGTAPLARSKELKKRTEDIFGEGWRPEVDTMDTFVDSSWYFYRYLDNHNNENFADAEKRKAWMPIDMYFGGAEHTTMHLLYSRFWTKALYKIGLVDKNEPYKGRLNRGLILGPDGLKMSKSKGNVIDPDEVVNHVGADTVRMYLAFIGPFNEPGNYPWDPNGVVGIRRFIERMYSITEKLGDVSSDEVIQLTHRTIKKVTDDIERLKLNTAISSMMIWVNKIEKEEAVGNSEYEMIIKMLASFAPHIAEEIWQEELGHNESIHLALWPAYDEKFILEEEIQIPVQVNGKVRAQMNININTEKEKVQLQALALPEIKKWVGGKEIKKFIYIKGKIVNIVI